MDFVPSPIDPLLSFSPVRVSFNTGKAVSQKLGSHIAVYVRQDTQHLDRSGVEIKLLLESHYGGSQVFELV